MCCCPSGNISELVITPSHNITIESGTTVSLNCTAKHTSEQDCSMCLVWKHEDRVLSDVRFATTNRTLSNTLPLNVTMSTQGVYSCQTNRTMTQMVQSVYITAASENTVINFYVRLILSDHVLQVSQSKGLILTFALVMQLTSLV